MTGGRKERDALDRLTAALVDEILTASDDEIIADVQADGMTPEDAAAATRTLFEKAFAGVAKRRLTEAKRAVAHHRARSVASAPLLDPAEARRRLERSLSQDPHLTLAARRGQGFSDDDVKGIIEDLRELGLSPHADNN